MLNAIILLIAVGGIAWEAVRRFSEPPPVAGVTVIVVAAIGILINIATMLLFMKDRKDDLNIHGAFLHMAADAAVSLGVVIAGVAMLYTGAHWIDPVISLTIAAVIMLGTASLLKDSVNLAVDAVPKGIDARAVPQRYLLLTAHFLRASFVGVLLVKLQIPYSGISERIVSLFFDIECRFHHLLLGA